MDDAVAATADALVNSDTSVAVVAAGTVVVLAGTAVAVVVVVGTECRSCIVDVLAVVVDEGGVQMQPWLSERSIE